MLRRIMCETTGEFLPSTTLARLKTTAQRQYNERVRLGEGSSEDGEAAGNKQNRHLGNDQEAVDIYNK